MNPKTKAASNTSVGRKTQRSQAKRFIFTVTKLVVIFFVAISCAIAGIVGGAIYGYIKTATPIKPEQLQLKNLTSFVYDSKQKEIAQLKGEQNRILVDHDYIPENLRNAFVAIEDKRFYEHNGIDIIRIASAVVNFLKPGGSTHGGSTITQQLVRNITGDTQRTLRRKVQEQWMAIQLEKHLSKDKILDLYMNLIYMGGNYYGVEAASKAYFGKDVKDLTLAQCASLAGITNMPGWYAPINDENKKKNKERQEIILKEMKDIGYIKSEEEYEQAVKEDLKFVEKDTNIAKSAGSQSYFVDQVITDVKKDLVASGMSSQLADKTIYNNGLKIYTTMDSSIQKAMDDVFTDDKYFPIFNKKLEHPQASMVIIDPATGQVKALRGGYGQKSGDLILNRATQIQRQPGSTFKPIAVYGPAIDQKIVTPATVIDDAPVYMNGVKYGKYPENYDKGYGGLTSIRNAIINSINVVAAKTWMKLGPELSLKYLKRDGISRDIKTEGTVSIAMGGLNVGVSPLDMAAAYVPFINDGTYIQPITYTRVEDMNGNVILEKKPKTNIVYDNEATSYVMTSMLEDVCRYGTAASKGLGLIQNGNMPSAGKTGTTGSNKDKWFVGFTPYYVGAVWYGYDKPSTLNPGEYNQSLEIWHAVMEKVHTGLPPKDFQQSQGIVKKAVCKYSGKAPSDLCSRDPRGSSIHEEIFLAGTEPKDNDVCDVHVLAQVCKDSKDIFGRNLLFGPNCPPASMVEQVFTKRKEPYSQVQPNDPFPADWKYELPTAYCNIHGSGSIPEATPTDNAVSNNNGDSNINGSNNIGGDDTGTNSGGVNEGGINTGGNNNNPQN